MFLSVSSIENHGSCDGTLLRMSPSCGIPCIRTYDASTSALYIDFKISRLLIEAGQHRHRKPELSCQGDGGVQD